jgi:hypothetical protein
MLNLVDQPLQQHQCHSFTVAAALLLQTIPAFQLQAQSA